MIQGIFIFTSTISMIITIACVLFMPVDWMRSQAITETMLIRESMGNAYMDMDKDMKDMYLLIIYDTGVHAYLNKHVGQFENKKFKEIGMNTEYQIFQYVQRLLVIKYWLPYFLIVTVVLIVDAMGVRSIKRHTFKFPDTKIYHLGLYGVMFSLLGLLLYLNAPVTVSDPVYVPIYILLVLSTALYVSIRNYQKVE